MTKTIFEGCAALIFLSCVILLEVKAKTLQNIPETCRTLFYQFITVEFVFHWFSIVLIAYPMITLTFVQIALSKYVLLTRNRLIQYHIHAIIFYLTAQFISTILTLLFIMFSKTHEYPLCILLLSKSTDNQDLIFNSFTIQVWLATSWLYFVLNIMSELTTLNQRLGGKRLTFDILDKKVLLKFVIYGLVHALPNALISLVFFYKQAHLVESCLKMMGMMFYVFATSVLSTISVLTVSWLKDGRITKRRRANSMIYPTPQLNECD